MATLHIHLLGDFLLVAGDTPVTTVTVPRVQSLLAYLVLHQSAPQNRSHLSFLLWPDSTEAQAHTNLRQLLYHLRQSLPDADLFLHADKQTVQWLPAPLDVAWTLDVLEVEQALVQAVHAEEAQNTTALRQALERVLRLYRGDLLPSCYDEWILAERDRVRLLFLQAAERLIALLEQERDYGAAIAAAHQLLRQDLLHEAAYRQLMRLYALQGDRVAALRVYHTCATVLERELGTEPSAATRAIHESLVQSETSSEPPTGPLATRGTAPPLLGRKAEWRRLQYAWRTAAGGHPHIVILSGEAGIGKTRLAEEMETWVSRQGITTASARCYAALGRLAYAPVTTWLRTDALHTGISALAPGWLTEIARLVPEALGKRPKLPRPAAMTEGWQRQHFFEALARAVLRARQPLLLLLDDMQWCDNETLEWLHYLFRFEPRARVLLIGTVRAEEIRPGHPLVALLDALQRDGLVTEVTLGPLTTTETTSLAEHIMGHHLDPALANTLYHETEGNPLFVVEMARAGTVGQREREDADAISPRPLLTHPASALPPVVQTVLATRLAQLTPVAHDMANVAAVIGREFPVSVLARASGESDETVVRGLDELWQRRIVREQGAGAAETYDFSHDKLREQIYESLSPAYRRLLHRHVAEAFKAVYGEDQDAVSGQIAAHYEHGGLHAQAIPYYHRAGEATRRLYANAEAIHAFERAAALLDAHAPEQARQDWPWETAAQVYESLGDVSTELGCAQEASQAYHHAMTCVPEQARLWQARLHRKTASSWNHASTNPHDLFPVTARQAFQDAERILTQAADPSSPVWRQEWIELQFAQIWPLRWSADDMTATIDKARPIVEQHGTEEQREFLAYAIATRDFIRNRYVTTMSEQKMSSRRAAIAAIQQTGNKSKLGVYHLAFGIALLCSGHLDEAEEQLGQALRVGEQIGGARLQARCLTFLPFIFRRRGQVEQVRRILTQAQVIGAARNNSILTGHRAWVAWRDGNLAEAEIAGRTSVEEEPYQQRESNLFQWVGRWPLIGVALAQGKIAAAMNDARLLLDPSQQPPPEHMGALLEAALCAWDAGQQEEAHTLLQQAVPLAEQGGYL